MAKLRAAAARQASTGVVQRVATYKALIELLANDPAYNPASEPEPIPKPPAKGAGAGGRRRAADVAAATEATPATPAVVTSTGPKSKKRPVMRPVPVPTPKPEPTAGSSHAAGASDNGTIGTSEEASAPEVGKGAAKKKSTKAPAQSSRRSTRKKQAASGLNGA
ncbi:hypothetical protein BDV93DRAFT_565414 [Ceratobasidium sp. AG-I]|nr:hypothetical protein BDV93DRAFT_565414 [Ceratobasidium sp. AG-I]